MNERCMYCNSSLSTGDAFNICYACRQKQYNFFESLQAQLATAQERERAAVHDIELVIKGAGICHICADGDCKDGEHCEPKWRGPVEKEPLSPQEILDRQDLEYQEAINEFGGPVAGEGGTE